MKKENKRTIKLIALAMAVMITVMFIIVPSITTKKVYLGSEWDLTKEEIQKRAEEVCGKEKILMIERCCMHAKAICIKEEFPYHIITIEGIQGTKVKMIKG